MKKKILIALMLAVLCLSLFSAVACGEFNDLKAKDENLGNYEGLDVADGMSAYDLVMEAYNNWISDTNYVREEFFAFAANDGVIATRDTHMIRKVVGDKLYSQEIIFGTGMDSGSCAKKYYYDGTSAYFTNNTDKGDLSMDKSTKALSTSDWGEFAEFTGDVQEENRVMKEHLTTYDITEREYLSANHDDKVYVKDGIYYCTITINCSEEMMQTTQRAAFEEFLDMTGARSDGFSIEDTTIDFAIGKVDGKMKFLIWKRNEKYSGKHAKVGITVSCQQTCLSYYTYGSAEITKDDLAGLNG